MEYAENCGVVFVITACLLLSLFYSSLSGVFTYSRCIAPQHRPLKHCKPSPKKHGVSVPSNKAGAERYLLPGGEREHLAKFVKACSRLYRSRFLQVNAHLKAPAEIYKIHSFTLLSNRNICQRIEKNFKRTLFFQVYQQLFSNVIYQRFDKQ